MGGAKKAEGFFSGLEWKWSLANLLWGVPAAIASFALPAWAVRASKVFEQYAPLSWVVAGFMGMAAGAIIYCIAAWGRGRWVKARYDARMLAQGGAIDPLEKTFERKRIYLNEFCLASHPFVENKTFIDCEIIGPANIILQSGNNIGDPRYPMSDAVLMARDAAPFNGYIFRDCTFRGCNFSRITFLVPFSEYYMFKTFGYTKWITDYPDKEDQLNFYSISEPSQPPPLLSTESETQP
ncbi:MAG: hypothetical protein ABI395_01720 [Sphingobium sp.]